MYMLRHQLSLLLLGCLGVGSLLISKPALAQSTVDVGPEAVEASNNHHSCYDPTEDQPEPVSELKQAMIEAATEIARTSTQTTEKIDLLVSLSRYFSCRGQIAMAESLIAESLVLATETEYEDEYSQVTALSSIVSQYGDWENYEKVRSIVDMQDESVRELLIQFDVRSMYDLASEENRARINTLFPELAVILEGRQGFDLSEASELEAWLYSLGDSFDEESIEQVGGIESFIADQVATIEGFAESSSQIYGYTLVGYYTAEMGYPDRALSILETAAQMLESTEEATLLEEQAVLSRDNSLTMTLGGAFISIGEYERGVSFIRDSQMLEDRGSNVFLLLQAAAQLIDAKQFELAVEVISEAEDMVRSSEELAYYLGEVAITYIQANRTDKGQAIIREIITLENNTPEEYLDHIVPNIAARLMRNGEIAMVEDILQKVTSPTSKISILVELSQPYYYDEESDSERSRARSLERLSQALEVVQQTEFEAREEAQAKRFNWVIFIVDAAPDADIRDNLLDLLEDEALLSQVQQYYLETATAYTSEYEPTEADNLRAEAMSAAQAEDFQRAVESIAQMESSTAQVQTLLTIVRCYVGGEATLDESTRLSLEAL